MSSQDDYFYIGMPVEFQNEGSGMVADFTDESIYIVSGFFTGWMLKNEYFELLGVED